MDFISEFAVALLAGLGGAYALLKYLGKKVVEHQVDKSLKLFDAQLERKSDALKTQLSIYAHEQNVALSRIDAQRAKAIQDVYAALREWTKPASVIAAGSPLQNVDAATQLGFYSKLAEQAHSAGKALADTLADNAIYFDIELYATLVELSGKCLSSIASFLLPLRQGAAEGTSLDSLLRIVEGCREEFSNLHRKEIMAAMQELTGKFRVALGIIRGAGS